MEENSSSGVAPVRFSGAAREYFGIWIVNFLLSIVTFGIYSAWAKVRNRKYFLGNTTVDGRPFDYHARGVQILIGRAIVVAAFVLLSVSSSISPILNGVVIVLLAVAFPWLINRGLRFNAAMTSWSNVRFRFEGSYWRAFAVFLLYPLLAVFTLYLATPFVTRAVTRYRTARHFLGEQRFAFDSRIGPFYLAFLYSVLWGTLGILLCVALVWGSGVARDVALAAQTGGQIGESGAIVLIVAAGILFVAIFPSPKRRFTPRSRATPSTPERPWRAATGSSRRFLLQGSYGSSSATPRRSSRLLACCFPGPVSAWLATFARTRG